MPVIFPVAASTVPDIDRTLILPVAENAPALLTVPVKISEVLDIGELNASDQ